MRGALEAVANNQPLAPAHPMTCWAKSLLLQGGLGFLSSETSMVTTADSIRSAPTGPAPS